MNVEDNRRVYEARDAYLRLPTSFGKSVRYEVLLDRKQSKWGSYAIILVGVTYDWWLELFLNLHMDNLRKRYNFMKM